VSDILLIRSCISLLKKPRHFSPVSFSINAKRHFFLVFHFSVTETIVAPR